MALIPSDFCLLLVYSHTRSEGISATKPSLLSLITFCIAEHICSNLLIHELMKVMLVINFWRKWVSGEQKKKLCSVRLVLSQRPDACEIVRVWPFRKKLLKVSLMFTRPSLWNERLLRLVNVCKRWLLAHLSQNKTVTLNNLILLSCRLGRFRFRKIGTRDSRSD